MLDTAFHFPHMPQLIDVEPYLLLAFEIILLNNILVFDYHFLWMLLI